MPKKAAPKKAASKAAASAKKSILIVDDHPVFRAGLTALVNLESDLVIGGEAHDAAQAMSAIESLRPDLVLMDMSLPGKSGLELLKDVRAMHPGLPVLIISMHDEAIYAERVLKAGGRGYIMKQAGPDKVIEAVRRVLGGRVFVSDSISAQILDAMSDSRGSSAGGLLPTSDERYDVRGDCCFLSDLKGVACVVIVVSFQI